MLIHEAELTPSLADDLHTSVAELTPSIVDELPSSARVAWQEMIDSTLLLWLRSPTMIEDSDVDPAIPAIIRLSLDLAEKCRDQGLPAPNSIVPDPNGGIVFERKEGDVSELFHVWDDGTMEYMRFHGDHLVERRAL